MPLSVYVETSVISYYVARPSRDVVVAARQAITQEWWLEVKNQFDIFISVLVTEEAGNGDSAAAEKRLELIKTIPLIEINNDAQSLA